MDRDLRAVLIAAAGGVLAALAVQWINNRLSGCKCGQA